MPKNVLPCFNIRKMVKSPEEGKDYKVCIYDYRIIDSVNVGLILLTSKLHRLYNNSTLTHSLLRPLQNCLLPQCLCELL